MALSRHRIPFQVAAGVAFYERAEVRDLLAYLRILTNPEDDAAFLRVVNRPLRGIGKTTQQRLVQWAESQKWPLWVAARRADQNPAFSKQAVARLKAFVHLLEGLSLADAGSVEALLHAVLDRTGYARGWEDRSAERDIERLAVVRELLRLAADYDRSFGDEATVQGFLECASLSSDGDTLDETAGKVTLMTLHAAKGLEFPIVFIVALEHNVIPHERALAGDDPRELEEERRLLFVGMTRAMKRLVLTRALRRAVRGRVFDEHVAPALVRREKVAYFLVDSLR
ncbi:MAG TPA: ATP-dependent DNA helicase, partial [Planctomycetaceae bacterium]|nr:ATP-dependent DNA helicase [Planctomycetaceae bacterium]